MGHASQRGWQNGCPAPHFASQITPAIYRASGDALRAAVLDLMMKTITELTNNAILAIVVLWTLNEWTHEVNYVMHATSKTGRATCSPFLHPTIDNVKVVMLFMLALWI